MLMIICRVENFFGMVPGNFYFAKNIFCWIVARLKFVFKIIVSVDANKLLVLSQVQRSTTIERI